MSIKEALGLESDGKVRYGIVGLGDISQEALMPGVQHTGNSEITALITGDPQKARALAERYEIANLYSYDEFAKLLTSGTIDAVYIATPNWRHAEFAIPALQAGIHVLLEKPMEVDSEKCREIINAQRSSGAKLMIAYRLHFEPATLALIDPSAILPFGVRPTCFQRDASSGRAGAGGWVTFAISRFVPPSVEARWMTSSRSGFPRAVTCSKLAASLPSLRLPPCRCAAK